MGWRGDRDDYLAEFERRSFGVITREEAMAMAILCEELGPDYETQKRPGVRPDSQPSARASARSAGQDRPGARRDARHAVGRGAA
jgi:hypothetical protein